MAKVILTVHGMNNYPVGYSEEWYKCFNPPEEWTRGEYYWDTLNEQEWSGVEKITRKLAEPFRNFLLPKEDRYLDVPKYSIGGVKKNAVPSLASVLEQYQNDEVIILAHSLGSVLAYEALSYLGSQAYLQNFTLVTFGSPLTCELERWFLMVQEKNIFPRKWINVSGFKDLVGGRELKFANFGLFGPNLWVNTTHNEEEYLTALSKNPTFMKLFS